MSRTHVRLVRAGRALVLAAVVTALAAGPAAAGKGGKPGGGGGTTTTFTVDDGRFGGTTRAHDGTGTWVHARCYQGGTLVYEQYLPYSNGVATLTLGPTPLWTGGAASCVGEDGWWQNGSRWRVIATDAFSVSG